MPTASERTSIPTNWVFDRLSVYVMGSTVPMRRRSLKRALDRT